MTTQSNDNLIAALRGIGFSKNEATVYLAVLELGPSSIWEISKKSGIKRPTCYVLLEELSIKGFAGSANDGKKIIYSVISPKQLIRVGENRYDKLISATNQLEALASKSSEKPRIRIYEGWEGIKQIYNQALEQPKGSDFLLSGTNMVGTALKDFFLNYFIPHRVQRGLITRSIFPNIESNRTYVKQYNLEAERHKTRFLLPGKFKPQTQEVIFGNTVAFNAYSEKQPFATVIESAVLAFDERQKFDLLWEIAVPPLNENRRR